MKSKGLGRGLSALLPEADEEALSEGSLQVPVSDIKPNPHQPRRDFNEEDLAELAASIREKGVIQPLVVHHKAGAYELIAGERRLRAAQLAGLDRVPVRIVEPANEAELLEISLIENLQRNDLNPIELAEGYSKLQQQWKMTQEQVARRVGKERATVANILRLLDLPETIRNSLRKSEISTGHAKVILSIPGAARRSALWKRIVTEGLSVRQAEEIARTSTGRLQRASSRNGPAESPQIRDFTDRLRRSLGTKVRIIKRGKKGNIRIEFYSDEELERLIDLLSGMREG